MSEGSSANDTSQKRLLELLRAEASGKLNKDERQFNSDFSQKEIRNQKELLHLDGLCDHYHLKKGWSGTLKWLLVGMIVFQWILLCLVGMGIWNFTQYQWLLPVLLVQNLGQIIGLAFIVVKSLFRDMGQ